MNKPPILDHPEDWQRGEILPLVWTAEHVGGRLVQAFVTLDLLAASAGPRSPGSNWPWRTIVEWSDLVGIDPVERKMREDAANRVVIHPSAAEISHMETAFEWLSELRGRDPGMALVVAHWAMRTARGMSIKRLCHEKGWAPRTFFRKRAEGLENLEKSLNLRAVPVF